MPGEWRSMSRFFLIDAWLSDLGGHNFQYALDVLSAAEERGYEPILAVHKSLPQSTRLPATWNTLRLFRYGFCARHWLGPDGRSSWPCDLSGQWLPESSSTCQDVSRSPLQRLGHRLSRCLDVFAGLDRRRRIRDVACGCATLFDIEQPRRGDRFFLPSLSDFDFLGLARFLRDDSRSLPFTWHLQFHFNVFTGRDYEFPAQSDRLCRFRRQFQAALGEIPNHRLQFYATTRAMAQQYDHIGIGTFQPLPYPVRHVVGQPAIKSSVSPTELGSQSRPVRVTFAGAMRREKGKKKIGSLIAAVWPDYLRTGRMQFVLQATRQQVARWLPRELRSQITIAPPDDPAQNAPLLTVRHPLDAQAYSKLIQHTDLAVFLYDSRRYYARASGILCEMLAAGIPAIVPAGCWLAEQIQAEGYRHVAAVCAQQNFVVDTCVLDLVPDQHGFHVNYELPTSASNLAIRFNWPAELQETGFLDITAEFEVQSDALSAVERSIVGRHQRDPAGVMIPIARGAGSARLRLCSAYYQAPFSIPSVHLTALRPPDGYEFHPRSRVGLIAFDDGQVPQLLREAHSHYEHYRQSAMAFAKDWMERHHPARSIELLERGEVPFNERSDRRALLLHPLDLG